MILAVAREHVEGVELRPLVVLSRGQRVEVRNAVAVEHGDLTIEDEMLSAQLQRGRIALSSTSEWLHSGATDASHV
jgi:hypothetical protein